MTCVQIQFENFFKYHITVYIGNIFMIIVMLQALGIHFPLE